MSIVGLAGDAYKSTKQATASPRGVEIYALERLISALNIAEEKKDNDYPGYVKALSDNLKFWSIIGIDAAQETSPLPQELRAQLFYLFEFTQKHTLSIIQGDSSLSAEPLIDINKNVLEGLRTASLEGAA